MDKKSPLKQDDVAYSSQGGYMPFGDEGITISGGQGGGGTTPQTFDLSQATVSGTGTGGTNPLYQSPAFGSGGGGSGINASKAIQGLNYASGGFIGGMIGGVSNIVGGLLGRGKARREQEAAREEYDTMRKAMKNLDTSNLYADVQNPYADMVNPYEENVAAGLENVYEDLTVNQQQAQFEKEMAQQSQANIMQQMRGAAGGSGIAALAQAMAVQGQRQAQRAAAGIGQQESRIQQLRAGEASRLQQAELAGEQLRQRGAGMVQQAKLTGEAEAELMRIKGAEQSRALQYQTTATEFGMAAERKAAAEQAFAQKNQQLLGGVGQIYGTAQSAAGDIAKMII